MTSSRREAGYYAIDGDDGDDDIDDDDDYGGDNDALENEDFVINYVPKTTNNSITDNDDDYDDGSMRKTSSSKGNGEEEGNGGERRLCGLKEPTYRIVFGAILVVIIAISWTGSTQFSKSSYSTTFSAPYFISWLMMLAWTLIFPINMLSVPCQSVTFKQYMRNTLKVISEDRITCRSFLVFILKALLFTILSLATNFAYLKSLEHLQPATTAAIFSSQSAIVYFLSMIFLGESFQILKALSLLLSVGGIVLMSYSEGFGTASSDIGITLICLAAFGSASYIVAFKKFMCTATGPQIAFFLSVLGILNGIFCTPFIFLLRYVNEEKLEWSNIPWELMLGTALLGLILNYAINFGAVFTYPLFITIGALLGIPLNAIVDNISRNENFGKYKIVASFMIVVGFCMLLLPANIVHRVKRKCCTYSENTETQRNQNNKQYNEQIDQ